MRTTAWNLVIGFLVALLLVCALIYPFFSSCGEQVVQTNRSNDAQAAQPAHSNISRLDCLSVALDKGSGALSALATVIIAVLTFTLWQATHRMAEIEDDIRRMAETSENTARKHERAYVHVKISDDARFSRQPEFVNGLLIDYAVRIAVKNNGRTPASVREVAWTLCLERQLKRGEPAYENRISQYIELAPQIEWATKAEVHYNCRISDAQALFAEITYEDVFRAKHAHRMLLRVTRVGDTFKHDPIYEGFAEYWKWD